MDVQTGAKIHEDGGGKALGEDIGELRRSGYVKNMDSTHGNLFADEMKVNFHVLSALMLYGVGGEVDDANIVAVDKTSGVQGMVNLLEQLSQPSDFSNAVGNSPIFCLGAGPGDSGLSLRGTGDQAVPEEDGVARGGPAGIRAACPINISVYTKLSWSCAGDDQTMNEGTLEIAEDPFGSNKVSFTRSMHMKTNLLNGVSNVQPGESEIVEGTHKAAVAGGISNRWSSISRNLCTGVNRGGARFAITHAMAGKDVQCVLALREED